MMTNEERLLHALYGIKKVLNDFGLEDIKNEVQIKDGNSETIDCISVLQEFVVNYVNSSQLYKFEELHKVNEWIPVEERLPKDLESVLVSCNNGGVDYGFYNHEKKWWCLDYIDDTAYPVIAWMPLPEPFKEVLKKIDPDRYIEFGFDDIEEA